MAIKKILAVIPARGGSKGIPKKNIRILNYHPLIWYVIEAAKNSKHITTVAVTSEDSEILELAAKYGVTTVRRPSSLAGDSITLDPVIHHALKNLENSTKERFDAVVTLQPTSPLLSSRTIDSAIEKFIRHGSDTLMSVIEQRHLYWELKKGAPCPMFEKRVNRQQLKPIFQEAGAIVISKRGVVSQNTRIGKKISLFTMPPEESIDIDSYEDWNLARHRLSRQRIVIRTEGYSKIGLGHIYRTLTLAYHIYDHDVIFFTPEKYKLGLKKIKDSNFPFVTFKNEEDYFVKIKRLKPTVVINDFLDTSAEYVERLKRLGIFVVNFEDLGPGSQRANMVFNSLYEFTGTQKNHFFGYQYECVRDEFFIYRNEQTRRTVKCLTITFGGTDQGNLTALVLQSLRSLALNGVKVKVILGLGYNPAYKNQLKKIAKTFKKTTTLEIKQNVSNMAKELSESDIAITSNGRTIYEVTALGIPTISISQNDREAAHLFSFVSSGIINLGHSKTITKKLISESVRKLIADYPLRLKMRETLRSYRLEDGTQRILSLIFNAIPKKY